MYINNTIVDERNTPVPFEAPIDKFGKVGGLSASSNFPQDICQVSEVYAGFPATAEQMEVLSSDAADTVAGTGARTVTVGNLRDIDGNAMPDVTVDMDGTTPVSLGTQEYYRSSRARVVTVGSGGANAGAITVRHKTTTANVFSVIPINANTTLLMAYTVPLGKTMYIRKGLVSVGRAGGALGSADITIRTRSPVADSPFVALRAVMVTSSSAYTYPNAGYFVVNERYDFKVSVEDVSDGDTTVSAEYDAYLVDN